MGDNNIDNFMDLQVNQKLIVMKSYELYLQLRRILNYFVQTLNFKDLFFGYFDHRIDVLTSLSPLLNFEAQLLMH